MFCASEFLWKTLLEIAFAKLFSGDFNFRFVFKILPNKYLWGSFYVKIVNGFSNKKLLVDVWQGYKYSSDRRKKAVLENFAIFIGKHLCWRLTIQQRCFPANIAKFSRTPILKNIYKRLVVFWVSLITYV